MSPSLQMQNILWEFVYLFISLGRSSLLSYFPVASVIILGKAVGTQYS